MKFRAFKYILPFAIYFGAWRSFHSHGWVVFLPIMIAFGIIPLFELFLKPDSKNLNEAEEAVAKKDRLYDLFLYLIVPMQYLALYWFLTGITDQSLLWWERFGRIMGMGLACGTFGINVGHELGHRVNLHEQWMAKALLLTSLYTHFFIEHNKGHHKNVSTPVDPSSAPMGMSLYAFWIRSVSGTWIGAWHIAAEELSKKGLPAFHWKNEMLQLQILQLGFIAAIGLTFGWEACGYFVLAAIMGFLLLETVNYIEHYGLRRKETQPGKYERALPQHSWNSNHVLGRLMLFELSRHSDHHYLASRKYQILRHHDEAPQLPTGYPGSMVLATIPPLWFLVMHKRIIAFNRSAGKLQAV
jgi:alkane 1-monooxygenase